MTEQRRIMRALAALDSGDAVPVLNLVQNGTIPSDSPCALQAINVFAEHRERILAEADERNGWTARALAGTLPVKVTRNG